MAETTPGIPYELSDDEAILIMAFRRASEDAQDSITKYALQSAKGWYPHTPIESLNVPDDGLIHLHDLRFDFEGYFDRGTENMSEREREEFRARIYGMFCRDVFNSGGDMMRVSFWAADYIAGRLYQALGGVPWEEIMGLPWDEPTPYYSTLGMRAFEIYRSITNGLAQSPGANVTSLIAEEAMRNNVSFETIRGDYYAFKKAVEKKGKMPKRFLNNRDEN